MRFSLDIKGLFALELVQSNAGIKISFLIKYQAYIYFTPKM